MTLTAADRKRARIFLRELVNAQVLDVGCSMSPPDGYDSIREYMADVKLARQLIRESK